VRAGAGLLFILLVLTGCAAAPIGEAEDPFEPVNRHTQAGFLWLDDHVLHPVSDAYVGSVPEGVRRSIHNALANLGLPVVIVNDLLQGNLSLSASGLGRLAVNSTAGLGGLFDVAGDLGLKPHQADFGQTFGVWGIGEGPYLFLPFFGPSNPRDAVGTALGIAGNPLILLGGWEAAASVGGTTVSGALDSRARRSEALDRLRGESLDYYAALRAAYRQNRLYHIEQGRAGRPAD